MRTRREGERTTRRSTPTVVARWMAALALLLGMLSLAACGGSDDNSTESSTETQGGESTAAIEPYPGFEKGFPTSFAVPEKKDGEQFTIGCQNPVGSANESTTAVCKAVEAVAEAFDMKYIGLDDNLSVDTQVSNFGQLLAQDVNGIVLYPLAPDSLRESLQQAKDQGVAVIGTDVTFTKDAEAPGYDAQVWEGRDQEAYLSMAQMAQLAPNGKIGLIGIGAPVPAIKYLVQRQKFWAEKFGLEVLGVQDNSSDDVAGGQQAMTGLLGQFGDIDGVVGYNDESAVGAYTAIRGQGQTGIKIISINGSSLALNALRDGNLDAVIQVDKVGQGEQTAIGAYNVMAEQNLPLPNVVVRTPKLITGDNIDSVASWDKQLADIKSGELSK